MFHKKIVAIALLLLVSFTSAEKEEDVELDDSFYDSRGEFNSFFVKNNSSFVVVLQVLKSVDISRKRLELIYKFHQIIR